MAKTAKFEICEKNVYCFQVVDCKLPKGGKLDWERCKNTECEVYMEKYQNDRTRATQKVLENIATGPCALPPDPLENWYDRFGYRNLICG
jgi:hypothetical protein